MLSDLAKDNSKRNLLQKNGYKVTKIISHGAKNMLLKTEAEKGTRTLEA
jgi:hypothetical protein